MKLERFLCLLAILPSFICAQDHIAGSDSLLLNDEDISAPKTIVDRINASELGKGTVRVIQDVLIAERIGRPVFLATASSSHTESVSYIEMAGWRIQVFVGNNQRLSKNEAFKNEEDIKLTFPEMSTYVTYTAPFWRLRVGDFRTYGEARQSLRKLRTEFPNLGREMSIVKERILVKQD